MLSYKKLRLVPLSLGEGLGERSLKAKPMQINAIFKNENYKNNPLIFYTPPNMFSKPVRPVRCILDSIN